jgi:nucleoside 2-deoxyribosyltransferase
MSERVYLAGPVQHVADGGHGWRDRLERVYGDGYEFINPLAKYDVPTGDLAITSTVTDASDEVSVGEIVTADKGMIDRADAVLVRWIDSVATAGTPMEILYAYDRNTPVVVWDEADDRLSPWVEYHATTVQDSAENALAWVRTHVGGAE